MFEYLDVVISIEGPARLGGVVVELLCANIVHEYLDVVISIEGPARLGGVVVETLCANLVFVWIYSSSFWS